MPNGVTTVDLDPAVLIDQLLGNRDGSTALIDVDRVAVQLRALLGPDVETRTLLFADLAWPAGALGTVWGDATTGFNGIYKKAGASGAGSWARIGDTPQQIVRERANHTGTQAISTIEGLQSALQAAGGSPRRPGEQPGAYAMGLYGAPEAFGDILLVSGVSVAVATGTGKILYLGDIANVFIPRQAQTVLPGRLYRAHAYVVRDRNPVDPAGASVAFGLGAMDEDYAEIGAVIIEAGILRITDGLKHYTCTFAMNGYTGTVDTFIDPAVAYVRPYVQTFGTDHGTQLVALWVEDITDVSQIEGASDSAALALAVANSTAAAVAAAADRLQVGLDAGQTAADRVQTGADRTAAEAARDASFTNAVVYPDIATGRAAVADLAQFTVVASGSIEAVRYRRDSGSTQTELARFPTSALVHAAVPNGQGNALREAGFVSAVAGQLVLDNLGSPNNLQRNLPFWYVVRAGTAGLDFPVTTVVDDQWNPTTRTARALRMRHLRGSSGLASTDIQIKQLVAMPGASVGRTDVPVTLVYHYKRQSSAVSIEAVVDVFNAAGVFIGNAAATKVSTDTVGDWSVAVFTATIADPLARSVSFAPRMRVPLSSGAADVDEDAWLGPVFVGFWRASQRAFDVNAQESIERRVTAAYPEAISRPWMAGRNAVANSALEDSTVGQTTAPTGFAATSGGVGTIATTFSVVADVGLPGISRALEVAHSNNGTVRTDCQFQQIIDVPEEFWGDTTLRVRLVQHVKRSSLMIDGLAVAQMLSAADGFLASLVTVDLTPIKGGVNEWVALAWEVTITNALARKLDIRFRTQVNAASGVVSGLTSRQTGFLVGWNRGADALSYDRNLPDDVGRIMAPVTARVAALEASGDLAVPADRWIDAWGNAHRIVPASRLGIWGDSQTDALEEYVISGITGLTGTGYGIGGETSTQILARMQGAQVNLAGLTWSAGTKRLRAARVIPPRLIDEAYRAQWVSYGAKIAEPNYVEYFNRWGRIAASTTRLRATATVSGDTWTASGHPFVNGDVVYYRQASGPSNAYRYKPYYVRDVAGSTFKLAEFAAGAAISFDAFGSSVDWLGDWYFDWVYNGSDDNNVTVKTHCPTDEDVVHLSVGTNDFGASVSADVVFENIQRSIAQIKVNRARFLVSGVPGFWSAGGEWAIGGAYHTNMLALHARLATVYPDNWLDIYSYLLTQGDGGANDLADIAAGYVPRSKRVSATDGHLNGAGQAIWAAQIEAAMVARQWVT